MTGNTPSVQPAILNGFRLCAPASISGMRELAKSTGSVDTLKLAILVALSISDDLQKVREELQKLDESVSRRSLACALMLDRIIP